MTALAPRGGSGSDGPAPVPSVVSANPERTASVTRSANRRRGTILTLLVVALVPLSAASLAIGSRLIPIGTVLQALVAFDPTNDNQLIIRELRIPRTIIAILAGGCLGLAGALMQSLTRNALAEPGTLGVNAGAAAGVVIGLMMTGVSDIAVYVWFAFAGAGIASLLVHRLGRAGEAGVNPVRLVLAGASLSIMLSAVTDIVIVSQSDTVFDSFRNWATGSLQGRGWETLPVAGLCLTAGALLCLTLTGPLNSVSLGTDLARALGLDVRRTWTLTNLAILVLAGGATAAVGPISFVGLAAPHVARALVGADHRWVLPTSCVLAALVLLVADILGRVVIFPGEIGAGIMTALIGAPFFVALVRRGRVNAL